MNAPRSEVYRVLLDPDAVAQGKSGAHTDAYHGHFARFVPDEEVVEVLRFETADETLQDTMTITTTLADAGGGTDVTVVHAGISDAVPAADNEVGTRMALANLARLAESR